MLAIEDAIVLVEKLDTCDPVSAALREFELARKPVLEGFRALEDTTVARLERMDRFVDLEPLEMAYFLLSH
jgi:2-polyprenyl-6-methoxyphenol hydroxylase-like FAD-dependent oxidoreductase